MRYKSSRFALVLNPVERVGAINGDQNYCRPGKLRVLTELLAFPKGRHDDQVDSVSQFLKWASERQHQRIAMVPPILIELEEPEPAYRFRL